jgi:hypothetical protein
MFLEIVQSTLGDFGEWPQVEQQAERHQHQQGDIATRDEVIVLHSIVSISLELYGKNERKKTNSITKVAQELREARSALVIEWPQ